MGPGVSGSLRTQGLEPMRICPLSHLASQVALGMEKEYKKEKRGKRNPQEVFGFFFFPDKRSVTSPSPHAYSFGQNSAMWPCPPAGELGQ